VISISQKCQYALRAIFELAGRPADKLTTIAEIASAQAIPPRFLELILNDLKQAGLVDSRRGPQGGYMLAMPAAQITVGQVIRLVEGPIQPVKCIAGGGAECPLRGDCAFEELWQQAAGAIEGVFDGTTFADLLERHRTRPHRQAGHYAI
jgi:Rrf2 family protein